MFLYQPGKKSKKLEFIDLYICESKSIGTKGLIKLYQCRIYRNWNLRSSLNSKLLATKVKIGNEFDINIIEKKNLF